MSKRDRILVLDDEPIVLKTMEAILGAHHSVFCAQNPIDAEKLLKTQRPDLLLLDLNLRPFDGIQWLEKWRTTFSQTAVVICSAESNLPRAIECMRLGALDYLLKPFRTEDLLLVVKRCLEKRGMKNISFPVPPMQTVSFVGSSEKTRRLHEQIASLRGKENFNILLLGETGTGKEVVARLLHQQEKSLQRPFVVVNTPALPSTLIESELFGVEPGAFTDAKKPRPGKFELADGGDVFLDEIGDLALEPQAKILRVLQEKEIERLGGQKSVRVQFRVISATNRPVRQLLTEQKFREDLFFRLADFVIWLPPLRERKEDIPQLAEYFLRKIGEKKFFSPQAMQKLVDYGWPGNVRQLESTIKRAVLLSPTSVIHEVQPIDWMLQASPTDSSMGLDALMDQHEKDLLQKTLLHFDGDRAAARNALRLSHATFYRKLQRHQL